MADLMNHELDCQRFEELVSDLVENALAPEVAAAMRRHAARCTGCATLLEDVRQTLRALADLPVVAEPPTLRPAIYARTSQQRQSITWQETLRSLARHVWQPRLATAFAMSVFSVAVLLNAFGVELRNVTWHDLQPSRLRSTISAKAHRTLATGIRYYNDLKVVYEIEAALRQMRQTQEPGPAGGTQQRRSNSPEPPSRNQVMSGDDVLAALHWPADQRPRRRSRGDFWEGHAQIRMI
jgi:hypothetical protein